MKDEKRHFKFGDKILNHWAGENNPRRIGVFIRYCKSQNKRAIECTDMNGDIWQHESSDEKLELIGSILQPLDQNVKDQIIEKLEEYNKYLKRAIHSESIID